MNKTTANRQNNPMRILIVGGGIAGLTLAALLEKQGQTPVVVEQRPEEDNLGYGLALWPHGSRIFHGLGVHDAFVAESEPMLRYTAKNSRGRILSSSKVPQTIHQYGHLGIIPRAGLLKILGRSLVDTDIQYGLSVDNFNQVDDHVEVQFTDGSKATFDLVIGADGIHSRIRELLLGRISKRDTGWGCHVWWGDSDLVNTGETTERWGIGSFVGTYPCREKVCIIAGAPLETLQADKPDEQREQLASLLRPYGLPVDDYLSGLPCGNEPLFLWRMADVRAPTWVKDRVALVGDAAAAFLPTAGIGASMALESAAVLAEELGRSNSAYLANALELYVKRRQSRVEAAQRQSRRLARMMFMKPKILGYVRNWLLRFTTMEQVVGPLIDKLEQPI